MPKATAIESHKSWRLDWQSFDWHFVRRQVDLAVHQTCESGTSQKTTQNVKLHFLHPRIQFNEIRQCRDWLQCYVMNIALQSHWIRRISLSYHLPRKCLPDIHTLVNVIIGKIWKWIGFRQLCDALISNEENHIKSHARNKLDLLINFRGAGAASKFSLPSIWTTVHVSCSNHS